MSRPTASPRELHVQAPELIPVLDLVSRYMGETRSVVTRTALRKGVEAILEEAGFDNIEQLSEHLKSKGV